MNIIISPLDAAMLDEAAAMEKICFSVPWSRGMLEQELGDEQSLWLGATDREGRLLGYVGCRCVLDECSIMNITVLPELRRRGIASKLLNCLFERLEDISNVYLEVRESNIPAQRLYWTFGFRPCGKRRSYYQKPDEDAVIMVKRM